MNFTQEKTSAINYSWQNDTPKNKKKEVKQVFSKNKEKRNRINKTQYAVPVYNRYQPLENANKSSNDKQTIRPKSKPIFVTRVN